MTWEVGAAPQAARIINELPGGKNGLDFFSPFPKFVFRSMHCSCFKIKDGGVGILKVQHRISVNNSWCKKSHITALWNFGNLEIACEARMLDWARW